jgi:alkanesulfonate monooxygenase SsuD/methylene tetrahydromethanopterin reductase-like flavin-dependent oxidoreductase (luciferase family)
LLLDQYASPEQIAERIALYRHECSLHGRTFDAMSVAVARQVYVATDRADAEAALARQAAYTQRTVEASRNPRTERGSHVLAYTGTPGATEEHALYGTPEEVSAGLKALKAVGVEHVLLTTSGGEDQLRRFAREIMPAFP